MRRVVFFFLLIFSVRALSAEESSDPKYKVALCLMATNKYAQYVRPLIKSARKYFFKGHDVKYVVFTDREIEEAPDIIRVQQDHMVWPYIPLKRFHIYGSQKELLSTFDYVYSIDVDALFFSSIGPEVLSDRVFTLHPHFVYKRGEHESNPDSTAYISDAEYNHYFCGGFWGGASQEVIRFLEVAQSQIDQDLENNLIAIWHDESHLNRYATDHPPTLILSPSYCYPENYYGAPYQVKILVLNKCHKTMRNREGYTDEDL